MSEPFKFSTQVRVRFNETDAQGHVNFAHYLSYFDVALTDYLRAIGYTYLQMLADDVDMLYVGTQTRYVSPAYFEEVLNIHAHTGHIGHSSVRFEFQVFANADRRAVAEGSITVVMVERATRRKISVPARLREAVAGFENRPPLEDDDWIRSAATKAGAPEGEGDRYDMEPYGFCGG